MTLRAPVRIDFAGGFADNIAFIRNKIGFLSSVTLSPFVWLRESCVDTGNYVDGSGLAVSTAVNMLEFIHLNGGKEFLEKRSLE